MAQTAVDLMDEYLGMKDGPERNFSQTLQDRRDESIGTTESNLVDRLFKSIQDAFKSDEEPEELSWAERVGLNEALSPAQRAERERLQKEFDKLPRKNKIIEETSEVITESPAGAAALDETLTFPMGPPDMSDMDQTLGGYKDYPSDLSEPELPSAMELAQMGLGYSSGLNKPTPELWEGLGTMIDAAKAEGGQLSKYEQMLLLASLGIPAAALSGRAVGGLMSKLGVGSKLRSPKLGGGLSAMRDMGPQAGNITGGAIALQKLGRPIPGRSGAAAQRILGGGNLTAGATGLASLKKFMGKESLRRPQVSKRGGPIDPPWKPNPRKPGIPAPVTGNFGNVFVNPKTKEVFERAISRGAFPKKEAGNWMYMYSDDVFDVFKDTITRQSYRLPKAATHGKVKPFPSSSKFKPPQFKDI